MIECMDEWHANPFDLSQPQLHTLPSGVAASYTFFQDLYRCNESNTFLEKYINEENEQENVTHAVQKNKVNESGKNQEVEKTEKQRASVAYPWMKTL